MKNKCLFKVAICLLFTIVSCSNKSKKNIVSNENKKPNVIFIVTDDQGYGDLGSHGNPWIKTPNLDSFSKESLELTNFHVGTTCAPTRAGLMTGRNANRNNTWHDYWKKYQLMPNKLL